MDIHDVPIWAKIRAKIISLISNFLGVPISIKYSDFTSVKLRRIHEYIDDAATVAEIVFEMDEDQVESFRSWAETDLIPRFEEPLLLHDEPLYFVSYYCGIVPSINTKEIREIEDKYVRLKMYDRLYSDR